MVTGSNLKTTELLNCGLIGVCVVIRSNKAYCWYSLGALSSYQYPLCKFLWLDCENYLRTVTTLL